MAAAISLLVVITLSFLIVRIGTIALTMTGLSEDVASFQSLSAFSGAGFTTTESENVLLTRARRRVVKTLIRLGSAGVVTAVSSLFLSFNNDDSALGQRLLIIGGGLGTLVVLSRSTYFQRLLTPIIRWFLRRTGAVEIHDYASLLHVLEGYSVSEVEVAPGGWFTRGTLRDLHPRAEGVLVLGIIRRDGNYVGAPLPDEGFDVGDRLILYGRTDRLLELSDRDATDMEQHYEATAEQDEAVQRERRSDAATF